MYRTHTCGQLRAANVNETVTLAGWVQKVRNLGAMTFIDLRDRYGITQIVVEEHSPADVKAVAGGLGREYVLQVEGRVVERSSKNPKMPTGDIEVVASKLVVLHEAEVPPFTIEENSDGGDDLRMKYRYLDLRRPPLQRNMILRHKMAQEIRRFLSDEGFLEIETPYLVNSTPEGARDFVVPSRMSPNQFYALPQSPQTLKQLLMVAGYDKYFQIVRCFRDEDLRADRQPEFTQIDMEMSFVTEDDVMAMNEGLVKRVFREVLGVDVETPFRRMPYSEAMARYGSDKPDTRFGLELQDVTDVLRESGFAVFKS
uniref:aspartate--tRNA ligase n=1 Tax=Alistipes putredinis TaxID=28117 RepID=UPI003FD76FFE